MGVDETLRQEQALLRAELQELKRCQLQYFSLSITGTAAIFGVASSLAEKKMLGLSFLAPLLIVLPCWWVFFDKATTITRIVGYVRVLEDMIAALPASRYKYIGFENALDLFRKTEQTDHGGFVALFLKMLRAMVWTLPIAGLRRSWRWLTRRGAATQRASAKHVGLPSMLSLKTRHRYWMISWYTFFFLAVACCGSAARFFEPGTVVVGSLQISEGRLWVSAASFLVFIAAYYTLYVIRELTTGQYSYEGNAEFWRTILPKADVPSKPAGGTSP